MGLKKRNALPFIGGFTAAIGASLCCAGPLVLLLLGISGPWISKLAVFTPYRPYFILVTIVLFAYAGWKIYRADKVCEPGTDCVNPLVQKRRKIILWLSVLIVILIITSNYWLLLVA